MQMDSWISNDCKIRACFIKRSNPGTRQFNELNASNGLSHRAPPATACGASAKEFLIQKSDCWALVGAVGQPPFSRRLPGRRIVIAAPDRCKTWEPKIALRALSVVSCRLIRAIGFCWCQRSEIQKSAVSGKRSGVGDLRQSPDLGHARINRQPTTREAQSVLTASSGGNEFGAAGRLRCRAACVCLLRTRCSCRRTRRRCCRLRTRACAWPRDRETSGRAR